MVSLFEKPLKIAEFYFFGCLSIFPTTLNIVDLFSADAFGSLDRFCFCPSLKSGCQKSMSRTRRMPSPFIQTSCSKLSSITKILPSVHESIWSAILISTLPFRGITRPRWALSLVFVGPRKTYCPKNIEKRVKINLNVAKRACLGASR